MTYTDYLLNLDPGTATIYGPQLSTYCYDLMYQGLLDVSETPPTRKGGDVPAFALHDDLEFAFDVQTTLAGANYAGNGLGMELQIIAVNKLPAATGRVNGWTGLTSRGTTDDDIAQTAHGLADGTPLSIVAAGSTTLATTRFYYSNEGADADHFQVSLTKEDAYGGDVFTSMGASTANVSVNTFPVIYAALAGTVADPKTVGGVSQVDCITITAHGLYNGQAVTCFLNSSAGLTEEVTYFVGVLDANTIVLGTTPDNAARAVATATHRVNVTDAGTCILEPQPQILASTGMLPLELFQAGAKFGLKLRRPFQGLVMQEACQRFVYARFLPLQPLTAGKIRVDIQPKDHTPRSFFPVGWTIQ